MTKPVIILGAGGHARVLLGCLLAQTREVTASVAPEKSGRPEFKGLRHLYSDDDVLAFDATEIELVNGVGSLPHASALRQKLFLRFVECGYTFSSLIASSAVVSAYSVLGHGVQILPGAIVNACEIADNVVINSGAIIEHDVHVGRHCHIAPGAIVCGNVVIADNVHVGAGATVIQGIKIGAGAVIGAGSVVTKDVPANAVHYPPRPIIKKEE